MPAPNPKIVALEKQLGAQTKNLAALQVELDAAADRDEKPLIVQIQSEIVATEILIKSTERRLDAARQRETAEGKEARKAENLATVKIVQDELRRQQQLAPSIVPTIEKLAEQLEAMHASGRAARTAAAALVRQLPRGHQREQMWGVLRAVEGAGTFGGLLSGLLHKYRIFTGLAPNGDMQPRQSPLVEDERAFPRRTEQLSSAVRQLAERVNAEI